MNVWIAAFKKSLTSRLFLILAGMTFMYVAAGYALASIYGWPIDLHTMLYTNVFKMGAMAFFVCLISYRCFYIMIFVRPRHLTVTILKDLRDNYFTPEKIAGGIPVIILFVIMLSVFTSFKSMIPVIEPFKYDALFAKWDATLHFGTQPWEILFPFLKIAFVTTALSFVYKTWFLAKFGVLFWQAFAVKRPLLREQFFITYMLSWIINGTILATLFSSAGPCYYHHMVEGPNPYGPLMEFLHESDKILPVWDLFAQDYLWHSYENLSAGLFSGISAMPSMHISLSFLFALVGWRVGRKTGMFFTVYLILMFVGSVHLGWHYAIDGYVGALVTLLLWWLVGKFINTGKELA